MTFGKRINLSGANPARRDPSFQQRTYDAGLGIYDYRNRSFDPSTGRFLQRDPVIGGDTLYNPYVFPGNNPVGNVDPMGTEVVHYVFHDKKGKKRSFTAWRVEGKMSNKDEVKAEVKKAMAALGKPATSYWYARRVRTIYRSVGPHPDPKLAKHGAVMQAGEKGGTFIFAGGSAEEAKAEAMAFVTWAQSEHDYRQAEAKRLNDQCKAAVKVAGAQFEEAEAAKIASKLKNWHTTYLARTQNVPAKYRISPGTFLVYYTRFLNRKGTLYEGSVRQTGIDFRKLFHKMEARTSAKSPALKDKGSFPKDATELRMTVFPIMKKHKATWGEVLEGGGIGQNEPEPYAWNVFRPTKPGAFIARSELKVTQMDSTGSIIPSATWQDDPLKRPGEGKLKRAAVFGGIAPIHPKAASLKMELRMQDHTLQSLEFTRAK